MELEVVIRIPVGGATLTIPTRQTVFDGVAARVVDSTHVAAVDGLKSVELAADGRLLLELRTGERYQFPVAALLDGGKRDAKLELRESVPGGPAAFGGLEEKVRCTSCSSRGWRRCGSSSRSPRRHRRAGQRVTRITATAATARATDRRLH